MNSCSCRVIFLSGLRCARMAVWYMTGRDLTLQLTGIILWQQMSSKHLATAPCLAHPLYSHAALQRCALPSDAKPNFFHYDVEKR